jgi:uncharacterized membrane protein YkoI
MVSFGRLGTLAVLGLGLGLSVASSRADEEKIPVEKVPKAVIKAFKEKFPEATIKAAIKEEEDGKTVYEIESVQGELTVDAVLKPDGEFVEIEKELKTSDLPKAVTAAVKAKHPKAKLKKAEELIKGGKSVYEVVVELADGKTEEVVVDKSGKIVE